MVTSKRFPFTVLVTPDVISACVELCTVTLVASVGVESVFAIVVSANWVSPDFTLNVSNAVFTV